jgi:hypothetical protein
MMPMSASVLVPRDATLTMVEDALEMLPEELRRARWLLKERDEFLAQARREGDAIVDAARVQAARMVERTEIAREAQRVADQVVAGAVVGGGAAAPPPRRLRHEVEDYLEARLVAFEEVLERTLATVRTGRERLQVLGPEPVPEAEPGVGLFDQDDV